MLSCPAIPALTRMTLARQNTAIQQTQAGTGAWIPHLSIEEVQQPFVSETQWKGPGNTPGALFCLILATRIGFEPTISALTGQYVKPTTPPGRKRAAMALLHTFRVYCDKTTLSSNAGIEDNGQSGEAPAGIMVIQTQPAP